jgi:hypothetical protein
VHAVLPHFVIRPAATENYVGSRSLIDDTAAAASSRGRPLHRRLVGCDFQIFLGPPGTEFVTPFLISLLLLSHLPFGVVRCCLCMAATWHTRMTGQSNNYVHACIIAAIAARSFPLRDICLSVLRHPVMVHTAACVHTR